MKKLAFLLLLFPAIAQAQTLGSFVSQNNIAAIDSMIKAGANPNELDSYGASPLQTACRWGKIDAVKVLLKNGAKVDEPRSSNGRTALMVACAYYGCSDVCKLLVENGANVNAADNNGDTPLMLAAANAKLDVVQYLISKGADINAKSNSGFTAVTYAKNIQQSTLDYMKSMKGCVIDKDTVISLLKVDE